MILPSSNATTRKTLKILKKDAGNNRGNRRGTIMQKRGNIDEAN